MSTVTISYPNVIPIRRESQLVRILILWSLVLIAVALLVIVISANTDSIHPAPSIRRYLFLSQRLPAQYFNPAPLKHQRHPLAQEVSYQWCRYLCQRHSYRM